MRHFNHSLWSRLLTVGLPFFKSPSRWWAYFGLVVVVVLLLAINGLNVVNSYVGRDFMTTLAERQGTRFFTYAGLLAGVFALLTVAQVFASYAQQWLGLLWRGSLTRSFLDRYLAGRTYLRLAQQHDIDNPDQRISDDVKTYSQTTLSILVLLVNGVLTLIAFSGVLWLITPWLFLVALGYAAAGSFGTVLLGHRLVPLNNLQLQKEADFRYGLGRVREHAQEVAQLGGEPDQRSRLGRLLAGLLANFRDIIGVSRNLGFFTTGYGYLPQIIPLAVVAPLYIRGTVEFGTMTQAAMAFAQVQGAFSLVVLQFQDLSTYAAVVGRLGALWEATEPGAVSPALPAPRTGTPAGAAQEPAGKGTPGGGSHTRRPVIECGPDTHRVVYDHLTLWTPEEERPLVRDLSLEVPEGKRVAITGPGGAGKTALLLATAGLWPQGQGRVLRPRAGGVLFLPRQPCLRAGRLRDVLRDYPGRDVPDDQLLAVLREVGLEEVVNREGGLDAERDWAAVLSPPEQQALAFARLLLAGPRFAFLDDAALDPSQTERLYQALARKGITYVSAGDHPDLLKHHDLQLDLQEDGGWQVVPASRPRGRAAGEAAGPGAT